jgi:hypothetical protein
MRNRLVLALVVTVAAAAAIAFNIVLLGRASAQSDPVGHLSPKANLPPAPSWTIRPARGHEQEHDGADD